MANLKKALPKLSIVTMELTYGPLSDGMGLVAKKKLTLLNYQIEKGTLKFKKADKKTYNIQLDFKLDTIYQVITSINETLILD